LASEIGLKIETVDMFKGSKSPNPNPTPSPSETPEQLSPTALSVKTDVKLNGRSANVSSPPKFLTCLRAVWFDEVAKRDVVLPAIGKGLTQTEADLNARLDLLASISVLAR
jgi:hypothetical protein